MDNNDIPKNSKVIKPWGSEYTIFKIQFQVRNY